MKRFHVNLNVTNLDNSILFYTNLFKQEPTVVKSDYAKWMLEDPKINLAINTRGGKLGVDHLGIQAENAEEFSEIEQQLSVAEMEIFDQGKTTCCYAESDKAWVLDPDGVSWETFLTVGESTTYNGQAAEEAVDSNTASCAPKVEKVASRCC